MKLAVATLAGLAALTLGAPSTYAEAPVGPAVNAAAAVQGKIAGGCFRSRDIRGHAVADNKTMYIDVPPRGVYRVTMRGACLAGAVTSDPLVMQSPPGRETICRPIDMDVAISKGGFPSPCIVDTITPMTKEEVAALPKRHRP